MKRLNMGIDEKDNDNGMVLRNGKILNIIMIIGRMFLYKW